MFSDELNKKNSDIHKKDIDRLVDDLLKSKNSAPLSKKCCYDSVSKMKFRDFFYCFDRSKIKKFGSLLLFFLLLTNLLGSASSFVESNSDTVVKGVSELENSTINITSNESIDSNLNSQNSIQNISTKKVVFENSSDNKSLEPSDEYILKDPVYGDQNENQTETETDNSLNNTQNNKFNESIFQNSTENEEYLSNEYNNTKEPISNPVSSNNLNDTLDPTSSLISLCKYNYNKSDNPLTISYNKVSDSINSSGIENIMLYYSYSIDNISWSKKYLFDSIFYDSNKTNWKFTFPNGSGYYRFFSIAVDNKGNCENKDSYDIECFYNTIKENNFSKNTDDDLSNNSRNDGLVIPDFVNDKFERGENVRVIIKLVDLGGEGHLSENSFSLEKTGFIKKAHISSKNLLAGVVNKSSFEKIKDEINIDSIYYDESFSILLDESLPLIGYNETFEEFGLTGENIKVCILDTGVNSDIVDIAGGYDFVNDDPIPDDRHGHGTQIASIIKTIAPDCELYVAKVIDSDGTGFESDVLEGLMWCIDQNPDIISFSIGSTETCNGFCDNNLVTNMCNNAWKNNSIFVTAAAGNNGDIGLVSPACAKNVFSVGSTDDSDNIAVFSNTHFMLDCFAPGVDIDTETDVSSGTSCSAAIVAGASALIIENESLTPDELKYRLRSTGKPISYRYNETLNIDISRINLYNAVNKVQTMNPYNYNNNTINETDTDDNNYTVLDSTSWQFPDSEGDTYSEWTNPTYAYSDDTNFAQGRSVNFNDQDYHGFDLEGSGFNQVPSTDNVDGIIVEIKAEGDRSDAMIDVELTFDDFSSTTSTTNSNTYTNGDVSAQQYGGSSDTWGETDLTGSDLADDKFRVYCNIIAGIAKIYYIKVNVYHSPSNNPPTGECKTPINESSNVDPCSGVTCQVYANDTDGDSLDVTWATNVSGSWTNVYTNSSISADTTPSYTFTDFNDYNTTYYWRVYINDGTDNVSSDIFHFTTEKIDTNVDTISPYSQTSSPLTINASTSNNCLSNVTLYYRYSSDNSSWNIFSLDNTSWQWAERTYDGGGMVSDIDNPNNILTNDGTFATFGPGEILGEIYYFDKTSGSSDGDSIYDAIPPDVNITGITVELEGKGDKGASDAGVNLSWDGGSSWTSIKNTPDGAWGVGWSTETLGGQYDDWEHSWSKNDFSDSNFRARVECTDASAGMNIDYIKVKVYYNNTWTVYTNDTNPDEGSPYSWSFNYPGDGSGENVSGYYEFYSIGKEDGSVDESAPNTADAICNYSGIQNISISASPSLYDFGTVEIGSNNYSTSGQYFTLTNNGNVDIDVLIKGDNATNVSTGAEWKLSNTQSYDNFSMKYKKDGDASWSYINTSYDNFLTSLSASNSKTFDLNLFTATTSSTVDPLEFDITLKSVAS